MGEPADVGAGRPVVLRGGTVLAMDDARSVLPHADVLVIGGTIAAAGQVVKHEHRLVGIDLAPVRQEIEATVGYLRSALGADAWVKGMHPDVPETKILDNPYTYTEYHTGSTHGQ
jgi:hypothetical protein